MRIVCEPARNAEPKRLRLSGMVLTSTGTDRGEVFEFRTDPDCWVATVSPTCNVIETWRGTAMLAPQFNATIKGWPIEATLSPGLHLSPENGLELWNAERASRGLSDREPHYIELATEMLTGSAGISLALPGGQRSLIVSNGSFERSVEIGEPVYFSELDMI